MKHSTGKHRKEKVGNNNTGEDKEAGDESNEREDVRRRNEGTKDRVDERVVAGRFSLCVELMTGIKQPGDCWDLQALLDSSPALPSSQEICGNLTPFGLKSPDKTKTLQLNQDISVSFYIHILLQLCHCCSLCMSSKIGNVSVNIISKVNI